MPPDYNSCLSKARIALETIVRNKVEDESGTNEGWEIIKYIKS